MSDMALKLPKGINMLASSVKSDTDKATVQRHLKSRAWEQKGLTIFCQQVCKSYPSILLHLMCAPYQGIQPCSSQRRRYCFGCRPPNSNTHAKHRNDTALRTEGAVALMGNVVFGDNDEILTAVADWRVERK